MEDQENIQRLSKQIAEEAMKESQNNAALSGAQTQSFDSMCSAFRLDIKGLAGHVRAAINHPDCQGEDRYPGQTAEMKANIMLSFRHLEDAAMRLGKAVQAHGSGESILSALDQARARASDHAK